MFEDAPTRPTRGQVITALGREDLELYGVDELEERIAALEAEIARVHAMMTRKRSGRAAADALFGGSD